MRVTQPFGFAQGREPVERQMGIFRQPREFILLILDDHFAREYALGFVLGTAKDVRQSS